METIEQLLDAWSDAEARGDADALDPLLAAEFRGDGPVGFVLDKRRWLDRHRSGDLVVGAFAWAALDLLVSDRTAVAVGVQSQVARYRGRDRSGAFACTLVAVRRQGRWSIVNLQLGPELASWPMFPPGHRGSLGRQAATEPKEEQVMASDDAQADQLPGPDPALKVFDRFIGTWDMTGRTLDSEVENVRGRATFSWLPGGFFVQQRIVLDFVGYQVQSLELIGYDPETGTFPSTAYSNMVGTPLPYRWEVAGDELTITTELLGATFRGRWSEDGSTFSGGWRPDPGREGPGNIPYDIWGSRAPSAA